MSYTRLVWAALRRRPARTWLTALSIVAAFVVLGALQGFNSAVSALLASQQPTVLRVVSRVNIGAPLPVSYVNRVAAMQDVVSVAGAVLISATYQKPRNVVPVLATDMQALFAIYPRFVVPPSQLAAASRMRTAVLVGRQLAEREHWHTGERITLHSTRDWRFDIAGIYDPDSPELATWVIANYDYINASRTQDKDTVMGIVARIDAPTHAAMVARSIDTAFENSPFQTLTQTERQFMEALLNRIGDVGLVVNGIVAAVLFTLLCVTANSLAQSVRERLPEFAVLKVLGFSANQLQGLVLGEALVLCVCAAAAGRPGAALLLPGLTGNFPTLGLRSLQLTPGVFLQGLGVAVLVALVSGIPLSRKARRLDVAATLAGSGAS